jgi:hypothetical protein
VQFLLDGAPAGAEVTSAPFTIVWNPTTTTSGLHTLAARARDTAGRQATSAAVSVTVANIITTTIAWPPPAPIVYGTPLSATQLNATTGIPGTLVYSPAAGTVLGTGSQTLSVTFTPSDALTYTTASSSVTLTVLKATPIVTWTPPPRSHLGPR